MRQSKYLLVRLSCFFSSQSLVMMLLYSGMVKFLFSSHFELKETFSPYPLAKFLTKKMCNGFLSTYWEKAPLQDRKTSLGLFCIRLRNVAKKAMRIFLILAGFSSIERGELSPQYHRTFPVLFCTRRNMTKNDDFFVNLPGFLTL